MRAISSNDVCVYVLTSPKEKISYRGHTFYYERIEDINNVFVINELKPLDWDWMYFQIMSELRQFNLKALANQTQNIGIISNCRKSSYPRTLWYELKETLKYFPLISKSKRIFFLEGYHTLDIYSLIATKKLIGFDVHSNFLIDEDLNRKMFSFDWSPQAYRKYKFNFIGNRKPAPRTQILQRIKARLDEWKKIPDKGLENKGLLWIEYGDDPSKPRGLPPQEFINCLEESDFTLCPPGYSKLTHRVIEALVKGSIPILHEDELALYDIDLKDGVNCISVKSENWTQALDIAMGMSHSEVSLMRNKILSMQDDYLSERAFSSKLRQKMGLN
ncbi:exostosin family protein [Leptothoe sp. LEGE 181152]|nr:exostosin family protein [Leptothoe sp. LEGE 181152]